MGVRVLVGPARGHHVDVSGLHPRVVIGLGLYEREVSRFLAVRLQAASVFYDVGAFTGYYSRMALRLMRPGGCVAAFEPDADARAALKASFSNNRLTVRSEAVGAHDHMAVLSSGGGLCSRIEGESVPNPASQPSGKVRVRSLDSIVAATELPPPDVVKIDVEGGEVEVLVGMSTLLEKRPVLAVECHSIDLLGRAIERLVGAGYERMNVTAGGHQQGPPTLLAYA